MHFVFETCEWGSLAPDGAHEMPSTTQGGEDLSPLALCKKQGEEETNLTWGA